MGRKYNEPLSVTHPNVVVEWDALKNAPLNPNDVTAGSNLKVWWKCSKGHEWQARICNRTLNKRNCPECFKEKRAELHNKAMINKNGSLLDKYPNVARLWHPTKNGALKPNEVTPKSHKKVWWKCDVCNRDWEAIVSNCTKGHGCPFCSGRKARIGENDLLTMRPEIAKEWHPTKNGELSPQEVSFKSNKKAWWVCSKCGREWFAGICDRSSGNGCPHCAAEKRTSFPEQAVFFYLSQVYRAINRYVENNYELDIYLPELRVGIEYDGQYYHNSTASIQKEVKKDKYYKDNGIRVVRIKESNTNEVSKDTIFYNFDGTYKELKWAIIELFMLLGKDVVIDIDIARDQPLIDALYIKTVKENSLANKLPTLAKQWNTKKNIISPDMVSVSSGKKAWWICDKGHEWQAVIRDRSAGRGCPYCSGQRVLVGFNDLATKRPELAKEWDYSKNGSKNPTDFTAKSKVKVWWKCNNGHSWESTIANRSNGNGCPFCRGHVLIKGINDLATVKPTVAKEWHPSKNGLITPADIIAGSNKKVWWKCNNGHEWQAAVCDRVKGYGCRICGIKKGVEHRNDILIANNGSLQTHNHDLSKEWNYEKNGELTPYDVTPKSNKKVWWKCSKGHEWQASVNNRSKGNGCPVCSGYQVVDGYNDLMSCFPQLVDEWDYEKNGSLNPSDIYFGSVKRVHWICKNGHRWAAPINRRTSKRDHSGCPVCSNQRVLPGYNDLASQNPDVAEEWNYEKNGELTPADVTPKSNKRVWWKCSKGHEWETTINNRSKGHGCPQCNNRKMVRNADTGEEFMSITSASEKYHISISAISSCCRGVTKTAGGYHWQFDENG